MRLHSWHCHSYFRHSDGMRHISFRKFSFSSWLRILILFSYAYLWFIYFEKKKCLELLSTKLFLFMLRNFKLLYSFPFYLLSGMCFEAVSFSQWLWFVPIPCYTLAWERNLELSHVTAGHAATLGTDWQSRATLEVHSAWDAGMQLLNIYQREVQAPMKKSCNVCSLFLALKNSASL